MSDLWTQLYLEMIQKNVYFYSNDISEGNMYVNKYIYLFCLLIKREELLT